MAATQVWPGFAVKCDYLAPDAARTLYTTYDHILGKLVNIIRHPDPWTIKSPRGARGDRA